jgi:hypothetical protein
VLALLIAVGGIALGFALPSGRVPDCPPAPSGLKCIYHTDVRPWRRLAVGVVAVLPAIVLIGAQLRPHRGFASAILIAGTAVAVGLFWISGRVPMSPGYGDCPGYRCYIVGHPYGGPAFLILLITAALGFWLWPHQPWDETARRSHSSNPAA